MVLFLLYQFSRCICSLNSPSAVDSNIMLPYPCLSVTGSSPHLFVCWRVYDVIHGGWRAENRDVNGFELLDPVTELCSVQTGHHYGVDQLACEERTEKQRPSFGLLAHWNVLQQEHYSPSIKKTLSFIEGLHSVTQDNSTASHLA